MSRYQLSLAMTMAFMLFGAACSTSDDANLSGSTQVPLTAPASGTAQTSVSSSAAVTTATTRPEASMIDYGRCPFDAPAGTNPECGTFSVPEDRSDPNGRQVVLSIAVFPATSGEESGPPLIYLEGGPGGEILEAITFAYPALIEALNVDRTVVLFDQRGTGFSEPSLACPEINELAFELLDDVLSTEQLTERRLEALAPCRARWRGEGIDLGQYNSAASASDIAELRLALGFPEWDLYGVSYGTRLALTVMRDHPEGVRSVILDSTYPPEIDGVASILETADRALNELYAACSEDSACQAQYGDVEGTLYDVIDALNTAPVPITVRDLFTGDRLPAVLDGDTLLGLVFQSLYSADLLIDIPALLSDIQQDRYRKAELLISLVLANQEFFAIGQNFSVQCHEEVPYANPETVTAVAGRFPKLAALVDGAFTQSEYAFEFCPAWGAGVGEPIENEPVISSIPTLVVAGQFDPITPPSFGASVAERLERAVFVEYPGLGHGVATTEGCPLDVTLEFLEDPRSLPDTTCSESMLPAKFTVDAGLVEIELIEAEIDLLGVVTTAMVPAGWEDTGFGAFYRLTSGTDETALLVQGFQDEALFDLLLDAFSSQVGADGQLNEVDPLNLGGREWRRFSEMASGLQVEVAMWSGDGVTLAVLLVAEPRDADVYFASVFIPAVETIRLGP